MSYLDDLSAIWNETRGDSRITIAVLDGPVDRRHPALETADLVDLGSCQRRARTGSAAEHGTHVCSIIFGQGAGGVCGIAPRCRGLLIPIFHDGRTPGSILPCSQIELAVAIERAVIAGANIINISGGQFSTYGTAHPILTRAILGAARQGVLIVSATGNDACACHHIPAADPTVLAVGAHDAHGLPLESSNWGTKYRDNGIVAPGHQIFGAVPGGTRYCTGTSFATSIVSGVAALLLSCLLKRHRKPDCRLIKQAMLQSAFRCFEPTEACQRLLAGRLNPVGALTFLLKDLSPMNYQPNEATDNILADESSRPAEDVQNVILSESSDAATAANSQSVSDFPAESTPAATAAAIPSAFEADRTASAVSEPAIAPAACGCGCAPGALVYALGEIGFDFGTEARRDSIKQHFDDRMQRTFKDGKKGSIYNPKHIARYLRKAPWAAADFIWTLSVNDVPIYAIRPAGPYAAETYAMLIRFFREQITPVRVETTDEKGNVKKEFFLSERAAIPGRIAGRVTLLNGHSVPVIQPEIRGMANWNIDLLVKAVAPIRDEMDPDEMKLVNAQRRSVVAVLNKLYSVYQNLGITPQDRAINYVATNIVQLTEIIKDSIGKERFFDKIEVEPSEICRPHSECWVVQLYFFKPETRDHTERKKYRITVDVSDVIPVKVGDILGWHVR